MILPLESYYSTGKAELKFGTLSSAASEKTQRTEAFLRPLWGLSPLWGGGEECGEFDKIYLQGIINGTNPNHPEYWGELRSYTQELCDSVALPIALALAPDKLWHPLSDEERATVSDWLFSANKAECFNNNWHFFQLIINVCLKKLGEPYSQELIDEKLGIIESFYVGDGWYTDGPNPMFDYYNAFAFHFYSLIYAKFMEEDDPSRSKRFKERAMLFAKHYIYFFDDYGREIPYGRSLTYRFGHLAFWSACLFAGIEPFPVPVIKGIMARNLRWWNSMPIFDNTGVITAGYCYSQPDLVEEYSSYGSPNWCLKSFILLMLPEDHFFWKAEEAPMPPLDSVHVIKPANMVLQRVGGVSYLYPSFSMGFMAKHYIEKYSKFVYSSKHAFSIAESYRDLSSSGADSMLLFERDGVFFPRCKYSEFSVNDDGTVFSRWSPFGGVTVETTITPTSKGHIRQHVIHSDKEYRVYDCGFCLLNDDHEIEGDGEKIITKALPNTNLYSPYSHNVKAIEYVISPGKTTIRTEISC